MQSDANKLIAKTFELSKFQIFVDNCFQAALNAAFNLSAYHLLLTGRDFQIIFGGSNHHHQVSKKNGTHEIHFLKS